MIPSAFIKSSIKARIIGEIGLDNIWTNVPLPTQKRVFEQQLAFAAINKKPLRKSVVSGEIIDKRDLLRIVKTKDGEIFIDPTGKKTSECVENIRT